MAPTTQSSSIPSVSEGYIPKSASQTPSPPLISDQTPILNTNASLSTASPSHSTSKSSLPSIAIIHTHNPTTTSKAAGTDSMLARCDAPKAKELSCAPSENPDRVTRRLDCLPEVEKLPTSISRGRSESLDGDDRKRRDAVGERLSGGDGAQRLEVGNSGEKIYGGSELEHSCIPPVRLQKFRGKNITQFLELYEMVFSARGLGPSIMATCLPRHVRTSLFDTVRQMPGHRTGDWKALKKSMRELFFDEEKFEYTLSDLRDFVAEQRRRGRPETMPEVNKVYLKFFRISAHLKKNKTLAAEEESRFFLRLLPDSIVDTIHARRETRLLIGGFEGIEEDDESLPDIQCILQEVRAIFAGFARLRNYSESRRQRDSSDVEYGSESESESEASSCEESASSLSENEEQVKTHRMRRPTSSPSHSKSAKAPRLPNPSGELKSGLDHLLKETSEAESSDPVMEDLLAGLRKLEIVVNELALQQAVTYHPAPSIPFPSLIPSAPVEQELFRDQDLPDPAQQEPKVSIHRSQINPIDTYTYHNPSMTSSVTSRFRDCIPPPTSSFEYERPQVNARRPAPDDNAFIYHVGSMIYEGPGLEDSASHAAIEKSKLASGNLSAVSTQKAEPKDCFWCNGEDGVHAMRHCRDLLDALKSGIISRDQQGKLRYLSRYIPAQGHQHGMRGWVRRQKASEAPTVALDVSDLGRMFGTRPKAELTATLSSKRLMKRVSDLRKLEAVNAPPPRDSPQSSKAAPTEFETTELSQRPRETSTRINASAFTFQRNPSSLPNSHPESIKAHVKAQLAPLSTNDLGDEFGSQSAKSQSKALPAVVDQKPRQLELNTVEAILPVRNDILNRRKSTELIRKGQPTVRLKLLLGPLPQKEDHPPLTSHLSSFESVQAVSYLDAARKSCSPKAWTKLESQKPAELSLERMMGSVPETEQKPATNPVGDDTSARSQRPESNASTEVLSVEELMARLNRSGEQKRTGLLPQSPAPSDRSDQRSNAIKERANSNRLNLPWRRITPPVERQAVQEDCKESEGISSAFIIEEERKQPRETHRPVIHELRNIEPSIKHVRWSEVDDQRLPEIPFEWINESIPSQKQNRLKNPASQVSARRLTLPEEGIPPPNHQCAKEDKKELRGPRASHQVSVDDLEDAKARASRSDEPSSIEYNALSLTRKHKLSQDVCQDQSFKHTYDKRAVHENCEHRISDEKSDEGRASSSDEPSKHKVPYKTCDKNGRISDRYPCSDEQITDSMVSNKGLINERLGAISNGGARDHQRHGERGGDEVQNAVESNNNVYEDTWKLEACDKTISDEPSRAIACDEPSPENLDQHATTRVARCARSQATSEVAVENVYESSNQPSEREVGSGAKAKDSRLRKKFSNKSRWCSFSRVAFLLIFMLLKAFFEAKESSPRGEALKTSTHTLKRREVEGKTWADESDVTTLP
ncbi:hypothetical protein P7C70_g8053, partial [Phenoliferia sp. Uapishka_3]